LNEALKKTGCPSLIVANGNGFIPHDTVILNGLRAVDLSEIPLYSPSESIGNCRGTSGAAGVLAAITAIKHQQVPISGKRGLSQSAEVNRVFVISTGVGGHATLLVLRRAKE
jgi:hypothetical protein